MEATDAPNLVATTVATLLVISVLSLKLTRFKGMQSGTTRLVGGVDGTAEGSFDGTCVGDTERTFVGVTEGTCDGLTEGVALGGFEGVIEGLADGR
jgi:hypothetical protein